MIRNRPKMWEKVCENPKCRREGEPFFSFRVRARFCSDVCRALAFAANHPPATFRAIVLAERDKICDFCGTVTADYYYVWKDKEAPEDPLKAKVYCGRHHQMMGGNISRMRRWVLYLLEHHLPVPEDLSVIITLRAGEKLP